MDYNVNIRVKNKGLQVIVSYKDMHGNWKQKSKQGFENSRKGKHNAKMWANNTINELSDKSKLINSDITFEDYMYIKLESIKLRVSFYTYTSYFSSLKHFSYLYSMKMSNIKTVHIQKCVDDLIKYKLKTSSIKTYIQKLNVFFSSAVDENIITINPLKKIKLNKDRSEDFIRVLSEYEEKKLLNNISNEKYYLITLIALKSGLRLGEILGLTWDNIDFNKNIIIVDKQWNIDEYGVYRFVDVKSKNSNRIVPAPGSLLKSLNDYKNKKVVNINNRLFNYKNTISTSSNLIRAYRRIGFEGVSAHELRHTYATKLISNGVDFKTAAKLLGHTVEMTMKTYSHVNDDMLKKATTIIKENF